MIIRRLAIDRLPGIDQPFEIEASGHGIHVIFGPNGIGKSSIGRAVEGLYWEDRGSSKQTWVRGEFDWDGETWLGERDGPSVRWRHGDDGQASPKFPPAHNHSYFFLKLRDLIDSSSESTADIALEIRRQMSGGFDLDELASDLFTPVTHRLKRRRRNRYNGATVDVQRAEVEQSRLQQRVDQLEQLEAQLAKAKTAAGRLPHVKRAIGLSGRRRELAGIVERLRVLPEPLPNLTGTEHGAIKDHQKRLTELEKRARDVERELQDARTKQKESGLSAPLDEADLAAWRDRADELERMELELEAAKTDQEASRNGLATALKAVGGADTESAELNLGDHKELFEFLRASQSIDTEVGVVRERLRLLARLDAPEDAPEYGEQDLDKFRHLADSMRNWLRAPQPQSFTVRLRSRWPWFLSAFALLLAGGLAFLIDPLLASIAAAGAGIGLAAMFVGNERGSDHWKQPTQTGFKELGLAEPTHWDVPTVTSALRSLESRMSDLEASRKQARDRDVERASLQNQLESLAEQEQGIESRRQGLQSALGLEALPPDAELVDFVRALDQLRLARADHEHKTGKVQRLQLSHTERLAELADILERYGEPPPERAAFAKARINNLAKRNTLIVQGLEAERSSRKLMDQYAADRKATLLSTSRIYAKSGLDDGDSAGLEMLLQALPDFRELTRQRERLESQIELDRNELEKTGEPGLTEKDSQSLEKLEAELTAAELEENRLRREIADVRAETEQARRGSDMQKLIAGREEARTNLQDLRDQALFATAGRFLVEEVEQEYEQSRMPRVFERARDHFSNFTFHNYELRLEKGNGTPRLFAIELRGRHRRELHELSDGTRVQLLLAARVAFAEEVEQGAILPLFLDEALDQSDPQRFEAIVQSLGCVARDQQRQIFYLTSDPLDVDRIRDALGDEDCNIASAIDLGLIRTGAASISSPDALRVAPSRSIPPPEGLTPEEYGAAIAAPALRPSLGFSEQHIFYVLWDDLNLLHGLLTRGVEWAGQWKLVSDSPGANSLQSQTIDVPEIGFRLDLLEVFCELWRRGRGRPVDRDALVDSDALSSRFLDDVVAIAKELDGDPEQLLALLSSRQDDRLRGFQRRTHERLLNYLLENDYLDERPILSEAELRLHALATPAANALPDGVANDCIHRWWGWAGKSSAVETTKQAG